MGAGPMHVYSVTTRIPLDGRPGAWVKLLFECEFAIQDLHDAFVDDGVVLGTRLQTRRQADGSTVVRARRPYLLAREAVLCIEPATVRPVDFSGPGGAFTAELVDG